MEASEMDIRFQTRDDHRRMWDRAVAKAAEVPVRACREVILPTVRAAMSHGRNQVLVPAVRIDGVGTKCAYLVDEEPYKGIIDYLYSRRVGVNLVQGGQTSFMFLSWQASSSL